MSPQNLIICWLNSSTKNVNYNEKIIVIIFIVRKSDNVLGNDSRQGWGNGICDGLQSWSE